MFGGKQIALIVGTVVSTAASTLLANYQTQKAIESVGQRIGEEIKNSMAEPTAVLVDTVDCTKEIAE